MIVHWLSAVLVVCLAFPASAQKRETLVFAAASLSDALTEIGKVYEASGGGPVRFNYAGSNDLARQIEAGAPAGVFISANRAQMERLEKAGKVRPAAAFPLLSNTLVVIEPREGKARPVGSARDLLGFERISLADPAAVPAGVYAKTWLEHEGVWAQLSSKIVPALDVRAALAAVAAGNLPVGVVYATDAASSNKVQVVYRVPAAATPDLRYFAAPVAPASPAAAAFVAFLKGPKARAIFARYGFIPGG
ncbi:MAG TPA: molybdate ABC transporter substrate-binding protein [Thermoanaerobaculia bacterium]|nr:molybdate ABC transporter substrate-binding protein [Thermoanaerobaculia bacterium]